MPNYSTSASTVVEQSSYMQIPKLQEEPDEVDIIMYERASLKPNDDIHDTTKAVLNMALENAQYGAAGERNTYGNQAGLALLEEKHDMEMRMKRVEADIANHKAEITNLKAEVGYLQDSSKYIAEMSGTNLTEKDIRKLAEGNEAAHEGDAVTDAGLSTSHKRFDEDVLVGLYGLTPLRITHLSETGNILSISTINAGATWRARGPNGIPPEVATAFNAFVEELKSDQSRSLTDDTNPLSKAYYAFWTAHNKYK